MEKFAIRPIGLTEENTILPHPAKGAEEIIVYVKNPGFKQISCYVNISGGLVVMGLDESKVLRDIEFNIWKNNWKVETYLKIPAEYTFAGLEFINVIERSNELELPVLTRTNETRSIVEYYWGDQQFGFSGKWFALSKQCFALVVEGRFSGFLVNFI